MESWSKKEIASLVFTGWGVLYSVALGWSFYNLLDQWPRLIRFGSSLRLKHSLSRMMVSSWLLIFFFVIISFSSLGFGAVHFRDVGGQPNSMYFYLIFGLVGLLSFITPFFINRAVWGFSLLLFPLEFKKFVSINENESYWQRRISHDTARKLFICTEYGGSYIFVNSTVIIGILCLAVSGLGFRLLPAYIFCILSVVAIFLQYPWPDDIQVKEEDYDSLPSTLKGKMEPKVFRDRLDNTWITYMVDFPFLNNIPCADRKRVRKIVFSHYDSQKVFETDPDPSGFSLSELSDDTLRSLLEKAQKRCKTESVKKFF